MADKYYVKFTYSYEYGKDEGNGKFTSLNTDGSEILWVSMEKLEAAALTNVSLTPAVNSIRTEASKLGLTPVADTSVKT